MQSPISLRYDLRAPAALGADPSRLYAAALDQCAWADAIEGIDQVVLSEHHGCDDGYCPAPAVLAAGIAGRTKTLLLVISAVVLPLHDPVRLAEDLAVLDLVSGGRLVVVFVAGYRRSEFDMLGRPMRGRARALEEGLATIRAAWAGEEIPRGTGTHRVTPRPAQATGPTVILGGATVAAARRAARLADGFMPALSDPALVDSYLAERERLGLGEGMVTRASGPMCVHVAEDPDEAWARIAPHALHETNSYGEWESERPGANLFPRVNDPAALRDTGVYRVVTPQECIELYRGLEPGSGLILHPLVGGLDADVGWSSLELFASDVLPAIRDT